MKYTVQLQAEYIRVLDPVQKARLQAGLRLIGQLVASRRAGLTGDFQSPLKLVDPAGRDLATGMAPVSALFSSLESQASLSKMPGEDPSLFPSPNGQ